MARTRSAPEEEETTVVSKGSCPNCDTETGCTTYSDGHLHCFSCGHHTGPTAPWTDQPSASSASSSSGAGSSTSLLHPGEYPELTKRGLRSSTLRKFGYFTVGFKGQTVQVAPYFNHEGNLVAQKVRTPGKEFIALGDFKAANLQLFGQPVFGDKFDKRVVVTEGELDAMSVAQEMDFGCAVVSIGSGVQSAAKALKANWRWLDSFSEIVLWFDDDEPGREASAECAPLFAVGKVKLARSAGAKDASDLLQAGRPGDIKTAVYGASVWRPDGIVNAADNADDVCAPVEGASAWAYHWPWQFVEDTVGPMLPGQVCYHVAGTGIGKTTAMAEMAHDLAKRQGCKVALMFFEDTRRDTKLKLMVCESNKRVDQERPPDDEMRKLHELTFGNRRIELFDPETAEWSVDAILGYIRYCAKALDCRIFFIDPLTFISAGLSLKDDERRALDKASRDLAALAKELGIMLHISHHLTDPRGDGVGHTEGAAAHLNQVRGSGGIANFASLVIGYERNQQAEGDDFLLTRMRALKNRPRSITGPMGVLEYSIQTGRLLLTKKKFPEAPKKNGRGGKAGASPPSDSTDY